MLGGVEVQRATQSFRAGDTDYPAGSYVVPMAQPFRAYAKDLLEPQKYPDRRQSPNGPPIPPYDITGWTLPAQMGVDGAMVPKAFAAVLAPVTSTTPTAGQVQGAGSFIVADAARNDSYVLANRVLKAGGTVSRTTASARVGEREFAAGAFVFEVGANRALFDAFAREHGDGLVATAARSSRH